MRGKCVQLMKPGGEPFAVGVAIAVKVEAITISDKMGGAVAQEIPAHVGISVTDDAGNTYKRLSAQGFLGMTTRACHCISVCVEDDKLDFTATAFEGNIASPGPPRFAGFH